MHINILIVFLLFSNSKIAKSAFSCDELIKSQLDCRTRLLRANLLQPLKDKNTINTRLDCLVRL